MKKNILILFLFSGLILLISSSYAQEDTINTTPPLATQEDTANTTPPPLATQEDTANTIPPLTTTDRAHSFVKLLEAQEIEFIGDSYHWRKQNPQPYEFFRCDASIDRARLSYIKNLGASTNEYYLVYLNNIDGVWTHDLVEIIFHPKTQKDGTKTAFYHVLKTMPEIYLLPSDKKLLEKQ